MSIRHGDVRRGKSPPLRSVPPWPFATSWELTIRQQADGEDEGEQRARRARPAPGALHLGRSPGGVPAAHGAGERGEHSHIKPQLVGRGRAGPGLALARGAARCGAAPRCPGRAFPPHW